MRLVLVAIVAILFAPAVAAQTTPEALAQWAAARDLSAAEAEAPCAMGDMAACSVLGFHLFHGNGIARDQARGVSLWDAGCRAGFALGCQELAALAQEGRLNGGRELAQSLFWRACGIGSGIACDGLAQLLLEWDRRPAERNPSEEARQTAVEAVHHGCFVAQFPEPGACVRFADLAVGAISATGSTVRGDDPIRRDPVTIAHAATLRNTALEAYEAVCPAPGSRDDDSRCDLALSICRFSGDAAFCDAFARDYLAACAQGDTATCTRLLHLSTAPRGAVDANGRRVTPGNMHDAASVHLRAALAGSTLTLIALATMLIKTLIEGRSKAA